jgi:hypothetical protein
VSIQNRYAKEINLPYKITVAIPEFDDTQRNGYSRRYIDNLIRLEH